MEWLGVSAADWISLVTNLLVGVAALTGTYVALVGLRSWRDQLRAQRDYEVSRRLVWAAVKLKDVVVQARFGNFIPRDPAEWRAVLAARKAELEPRRDEFQEAIIDANLHGKLAAAHAASGLLNHVVNFRLELSLSSMAPDSESIRSNPTLSIQMKSDSYGETLEKLLDELQRAVAPGLLVEKEFLWSRIPMLNRTIHRSP